MGEGSKDPADYWNEIMKGQEMPKALLEALVRGDVAHFTKDFDLRPNALIYHKHQMGLNSGPKAQIRSHKPNGPETKVPYSYRKSCP